MTPTPKRPEYGKLYGITYDATSGAPLLRTRKALKVGIGIPKGRAIHVFLFEGKWHIRFGVWENVLGGKNKLVMKTVYRGGSTTNGVLLSNERKDVEKWYHEHKKEAAVSNRPQKLPHFTFTNRTTIDGEDGKPAEFFEPDFEAIEAHGDAPKRIPVVLTSDAPVTQAFELWSATELKCHGDGLIAERVLSMGSPKDQYWQEAKDAGQKMFLYSPCYAGGCPLGANGECKPHSTVNLKLKAAFRIGTTAYFTTTGIVSGGLLFSSFMEISDVLEKYGLSMAGIQLDLVLSTFKANHQGKPSIQPCVYLETNADTNKMLVRILSDSQWKPGAIGQAPRLIGSSDEVVTFEGSSALAGAMDAEFSDADLDDDEPGTTDQATPTAAVPAAAATEKKTEDIAEKLKKRNQPAPAPLQSSQTVPTEPVAAITPPWANRLAMLDLFIRQQERIGDAAYQELIKQHVGDLATMSHDVPLAIVLYNALKAAPAITAAQPTVATPAKTSLF